MLTNKRNLTAEEYKDIQECILKILLAIDKVCKEHHLKYFMIAGTMLGAVRHGGFVPWDDDADVALPRKDYDILVRHANEWLPDNLELVSGEQNPEYPYLFARIQDKNTTYILRRSFNFVGGVPVDVFPLDTMTTGKWKRKFHYKKYNLLTRLRYYNLRDPYKHGHGLDSFFIRSCHKLLPTKALYKLGDKMQKEFQKEDEVLIADHDNHEKRGILPAEVYGEPTPIMFEGHELMGVAKPHDYLSYCYGNYMEKPKEMPPLNFRLIDLHLPYREYLKNHQ